MAHFSRYITGLACVSCVLVLSCAKESKNKHHESSPEIVKVKGNPYDFVRNTLMNKGAPLPKWALPDKAKWRFKMRGYQQEPRIPNTKTALDQLITSQAPDKNKKVPELTSEKVFEGHQTMNGEYVLSGLLFGRTTDFVFRPTTDGQWALHHIAYPDYSYQFKLKDTQNGDLVLLHTSSSDDLNAFSFLFYASNVRYPYLLDFSFTRVTHERPYEFAKSAGHFNFLYGENVKVRWSKTKPLPVTLCLDENLPEEFASHVIKAAEDWRSAIGSRADVRPTVAKKCPPFSDLRTHTVNISYDWIEMDGYSGVVGETSHVTDFEKATVIDSDVFILVGELLEMYQTPNSHLSLKDPELRGHSGFKDNFIGTVRHELGHFFGLAHQFDPKFPSIMSYNDTISTLQAYDIKAIQALIE